ncbi:hypothetical protein WICPIJ_008240 [Wickerhamomyces pijperi]|uniref:Uncharacterized protein n=1 Tax=Wickerhamomyces pijperi TaxID=599730 RepID=A0A9P8Q0G0_WICPI|nr:hypothetical protein WICPIJ_008240 [Wickerhamomyces pijperi]
MWFLGSAVMSRDSTGSSASSGSIPPPSVVSSSAISASIGACDATSDSISSCSCNSTAEGFASSARALIALLALRARTKCLRIIVKIA